jgi:hypothetical protein
VTAIPGFPATRPKPKTLFAPMQRHYPLYGLTSKGGRWGAALQYRKEPRAKGAVAVRYDGQTCSTYAKWDVDRPDSR